MTPRRSAPLVGARVTVRFLARLAGGAIEEVDADGRRLLVVTDEGEPIRFALNPATGVFEQEGPTGGAKLNFEDQAG